jgi:hypothetical protein
MGFPIEVDLENWVSFRVGATLLTLRPGGPCAPPGMMARPYLVPLQSSWHSVCRR